MFRPAKYPAAAFSGTLQLTRGVDPDAMRPRMTPDGTPKTTAEGQVTYSLPAQFIDDTGIDANVHVAVINPPTRVLPPLTIVRPTGMVRPVAWVNNGRVAWTLTVDGVEPVTTARHGVDPETGEVLDDEE